MAKDAQGNYVAKAWYCHACTAKDSAAEKAGHSPGIYWSVTPRNGFIPGR